MQIGFMRGFGALAILLCLPAAASSQGPAQETLVVGRRAIQIGGFDDGASFGFWKMRSANTQLGILLDTGLGISRHENDEIDAESNSLSFDIEVGPELRRYTSISGRVAPYGFVGGGVRFGYDRQSDEVDTRSNWNAGIAARVGLGAEFFPVANFSIGGQMGVGAGIGVDPSDDDDPTSDLSASIGTFGASLGAAIYF